MAAERKRRVRVGETGELREDQGTRKGGLNIKEKNKKEKRKRQEDGGSKGRRR